MGDPHKPSRYGETWDQRRIDLSLVELETIRPFVILSGGWAWHFMSPEGHVELKHAHDHKDIDIFVPPKYVGVVVGLLKGRGFQKAWTRYDALPSEEDFRRYEKVVEEEGEKPVRIVVDFFVRDIASRQIDRWHVVEPQVLLSLYGDIHSSDKCFAVQAATRLLSQDVDPVGHQDLIAIP